VALLLSLGSGFLPSRRKNVIHTPNHPTDSTPISIRSERVCDELCPGMTILTMSEVEDRLLLPGFS
jgi:hypothetical protein